MKTCNACQTTKEESEFNKRGQKLQPWCRACQSASSRELYLKNPAKVRERNDRRTLECIAEYNAFKATLQCARCPENDIAALDFHHLDPSTKERNIATAARSWTPTRLRTEIEKCIVLCSNCHRKLHYYERNSE